MEYLGGIFLKKLVVVGKILANEAINANVKRMVIEAPQIAEAAQPGQFVHVKKTDSVNFLRRPFSIADADRENGTITLIYRIVGKGTAEYAAMKVGEAFSILGPIGNGFALKDGRPLLIGGGVGGFLASNLNLRATGMSITGIPGTLLYLNDQLPLYLLVNVIAFAVAFALTWMFGFNKKMENQ